MGINENQPILMKYALGPSGMHELIIPLEIEINPFLTLQLAKAPTEIVHVPSVVAVYRPCSKSSPLVNSQWYEYSGVRIESHLGVV